ncbi:MAG: serine hydrolase [Pseudomonadota bacterium]
MNKITFISMRVLMGLVLSFSLATSPLAATHQDSADSRHKTQTHAKKPSSHQKTSASQQTRHQEKKGKTSPHKTSVAKSASHAQKKPHQARKTAVTHPTPGIHQAPSNNKKKAHRATSSHNKNKNKKTHHSHQESPTPDDVIIKTSHRPVHQPLRLSSESALVVDREGHTLYAKNTGEPLPIASVTKLMTAMVVLDAHPAMEEVLTIESEDKDRLRYSHSRLREGSQLSREQMLILALMSSENRAASALSRTTFKGGKTEFVTAMNTKAKTLGMDHAQFQDGSGLDQGNQASPEDLVKMVRAAAQYPFIQAATTRKEMMVRPGKKGGPLQYVNTNPLVRAGSWDIHLSKTGYIDVAGHCLVMQVMIQNQPISLVLLRSYGKFTAFADAQRVRQWLRQN